MILMKLNHHAYILIVISQAPFIASTHFYKSLFAIIIRIEHVCSFILMNYPFENNKGPLIRQGRILREVVGNRIKTDEYSKR